ncbi:MAG TPA: sulfatase [Candidatus Acidoferrales bacterium]|nr:sulfatase [Candidatus Acidoferrales bacterium]
MPVNRAPALGLSRRQFLASAAALAFAAPAARPNIIFLLLDDLGWRDFGCFGSPFYETPHLDKLASEGVRFTNAYAACPVCSPTRASILTGKYPARLHLTDWIPGRRQWPSAKLLTPAFEQQLPLRETTIAEALKPLGYRTASIGKWHLGGDGFLPTNQGFDLNVAGTERGSPQSYFGPFDLPNLKGGTRDDYLTEKLSDAADRFIEDSAGKAPFFLYLPEFAVHIPLQARPSAVEKYRRKNKGGPLPNPVYSAMVESADQALRRLRLTLDRLKIAQDTILFVFSDNGGLRYEGSSKDPVTDNSPLRAGKGHLFEGGIREPLLVNWPGVTMSGRVVETPVSSIDIFPTILEMAGARFRSGEVDGLSLAPLLRGSGEPKRDALFWHYPHYSNQGGTPAGAVRVGDWKLIEFFEDGRQELFNLSQDIGERRNLALREPRVRARLYERLKGWRGSVGAAMPRPNPAYDPAQSDQHLTGAEPATAPETAR